MKTFKVNKEFYSKANPNMLIREGNYIVIEWGHDGFVIKLTPLGSLNIFDVFISHSEVAEVGKVIVGFGATK